MDLVLPVYKDPLISPEVKDSKSLDYGRRIVETTAATNTGGLKKLFNFKELQSGPAYWVLEIPASTCNRGANRTGLSGVQFLEWF